MIRRLILVCCIVFPLNAFADSDGVFCVGKGYVALEARGLNVFDRFGIEKDVKKTKLYVDEKSGSSNGGVFFIFVRDGWLSDRVFVPVDFSENRNRKIACEEGRVLLSDGFEGNVIDITDTDNLVAKKAKIEKNSNFSDKQLPYIGKSMAMKIPASFKDSEAQMPSENYEHEFFLIVDNFEQSHPSGYILHHFAARAVQLGKWGNFVDSTNLANGVLVETVDPY